MIGYYNKNNKRWENFYGERLECFICKSNECVGSISYPLKFGGYGELTHCKEHEEEAKAEANRRTDIVTSFNIKTTNS